MATEGQKITRHAGGMIRITDAFSLPVTAVANSDFVFAIPAGARNVAFRTLTTTAYTAVTDAQLSIGKTAGGAEYVAAVSVKAQGAVSHVYVAAGVPDLETYPGTAGQMTTLNARIAQSGGSTVVGAATLFVDYSLPV